jgi:DNA uptake protein ComE-like DNA-binding protein
MKPPKPQSGFVLVLTLLVMVVVALAAGYFAERVSRSVELAQQSNQNTRAMIDMAATRAEILYRLGTTSVTEFGLGRGEATIYLDNRAYHGLGDTLLRVQDDRGLLNLNGYEDDRLNRLLGILGIAADQRAHLIDTLRDYTDEDDLHRLNGAEKEDYLALNLPPPPNRNLTTPWEANGIIGWRGEPKFWQNSRLVELTTTSTATGLNPNTAPAEILATLPGVTEDIAQRIIARRQLLPITNLRQLAEITGLPTQPVEEIIAMLPSNAMRITQSAPGLPWSVQYNITLTPKSDLAPWQIDYYSRVSTPQQPESAAIAPALPPRSTAPPEVLPL